MRRSAPAAALWPLLDQMNPDASTLALSTTDVDVAHVEAGQAITVMWRGKPIFIRHRTDKEIAEAKDTPRRRSARSARAQRQSSRADGGRRRIAPTKDHEPWLVMIGICTHLGCIPKGQSVGDDKGEYRRLVLSLPRLALRYGRPHPQRARAAQSGDAAVRFPSDTKIKIG